MSKTTLLAIVVFTFIAIVVLIKENKDISHEVVLKEGSVILAFGDSITYGYGAEYEFSYPKQIEKKTALKVINAGINGELSSEGLIRLPKLLENKPDLVILCHGGNDILQKLPSQELKNNLLAMIKLIKQSGAEVLLVGVPNFNVLSFTTQDIYSEVAEETNVLFEDKVLTYIELHRALKSDYVHPNGKGYEMMADTFIELLKLKDLK